MKYVPVLILLTSFIGYIQLQHIHDEVSNKCLSAEGNLNCKCCISGYRGQACSDKCQHCLSRYVSGICTYYCKTGYYGEACTKECPRGCDSGNFGPRYCKEEDGEPKCENGCIAGYYGRQCNQTCDSNCLQMKCFQHDGKCLDCIDSYHYGDHCNITCSQGCVSGKCSRSGRCTEGCTFGFYGEECRSECGSNCADGRCTSDTYYRFNCTEGCLSGYTRTDCLVRCSHACKDCNQHSGRCTSCAAHYVQKPETNDCTEKNPVRIVIPSDTTATFPWLPIVIAMTTALIIIIVVVIVVIVVRRRIKILRRQKEADHHLNNPSERSSLLSIKSDSVGKVEDDSAFVSDSEHESTYSSDGGTQCYYPKT